MRSLTAQELGRLSARRTAELVRSGELAPTEVVDAAITRISDSNDVLNAVVFAAFDEAMVRARDMERLLVNGADPGPLTGVPALIKDSFSAKEGWPVSSGLSVLRDNPARHTTNFPRRLEAAGAILLGTTNSSVFGFRGTTDSVAFGPCRNPFDPRRNAGGSSGGSAAAVAAGYVPVAGATDVGGSIRIPSAWCGTFGFQPSPGRLPFPAPSNLFGPGPYFFEGPITRTVGDAAFTMDVLHGFDAADPAALTDRVDFLSAHDRARDEGLRGVRVGVTADYGIFPVDSEVRAAFERAILVFERLGADIVEVDPRIPFTQRTLSDVWSRLTAIGTYAAIEALAKQGVDVRSECPEELPKPMMRWVDTVASMPIAQLLNDQTVRSEVFNAFERTFADIDLLVAPTLACMPVENARDGFTQGPTEIDGQAVDPLIGWCMSYLTNFTGHPSASVPGGHVRGLPVGIQITGRRHHELDVIAASAAFEQESPWQHSYQLCTYAPPHSLPPPRGLIGGCRGWLA
ncbi:amidase [Streptomyces sp. NL15-2K]|uniref:amidase n=1 Tax=Streptomyces sp. NL15-2K TaxID=376149 RepID=UPI000F57BA2B|nr:MULTISPECIES: amidase [Actinomycetes]WKX06289.1 amidase [Kutzneria buriramensis]GCB52848.1 aspartyl-tRNA(Asn) amidotransferase subunit A [Streptomyces sp. NL15-2K]